MAGTKMRYRARVMMVVTAGYRRSAKAPFSIRKPSSSMTPGFRSASRTARARVISALEEDNHRSPLCTGYFLCLNLYHALTAELSKECFSEQGYIGFTNDQA